MSKSHASNVTKALVKKRKCLVAAKKNAPGNVKVNGLDSMLAFWGGQFNEFQQAWATIFPVFIAKL